MMTRDELSILHCSEQMESILMKWSEENLDEFLNMAEVVQGLCDTGSVIDAFTMIGIGKVGSMIIHKHASESIR